MRTALLIDRVLLALLVAFPAPLFAAVEDKTWGAVKGLYRGEVPAKANPPGSPSNPQLPDPTDAVMDAIMTLSAEEAQKVVASALRAPETTPEGKGSPRIAAWWLTNQRILDRSYRDINRYVGEQCKPWVRTVVRDAVGVIIPPTYPNDYGWYWAYSPDVVGWCGRAEYASPGQILQMWLGAWNPHTAIIVGTSPSGMYWIDSNWNTREKPNYVLLHWLSYSYFYSRTGGYFTINQINR